MKQAIVLMIFIILFTVGCSKVENNGVSSEPEMEVTKGDLDKVKFYASLLNDFDRVLFLNTELHELTRKLDSLVKKGYELFGYEEGIRNLELSLKGYSSLSNSFQSTLESKDYILSLAKSYDEDMTELEVTYQITAEAMKEYENAYEQIELYIKTDNEQHYKNYLVHEGKNYNLTLQARELATQNKNNYYEKIMKY